MRYQVAEALIVTVVAALFAGVALRGCVACERSGGVYVRGYAGGLCVDPARARR